MPVEQRGVVEMHGDNVMNDSEITLRCALAMGYSPVSDGDPPLTIAIEIEGTRCTIPYNPLQDNAQAMELVKRFRLNIDSASRGNIWRVTAPTYEHYFFNEDLNRAACECVANA